MIKKNVTFFILFSFAQAIAMQAAAASRRKYQQQSDLNNAIQDLRIRSAKCSQLHLKSSATLAQQTLDVRRQQDVIQAAPTLVALR